MGSSLVLNRRPKVPAEDTAAFGAIAERFRRAGALDQAVSLCRDGLQRFPDHISARVTLGWSLLDLGKYDEARIELEQVLRRAPDNLAAIRGLAELHDRFEHTLHLPMDGPGQWPPPADAVGEEEVDAEAAVTPTLRADDSEYEVVAEAEAPMEPAASIAPDPGAEMAPADMGLPLWTPVAEAPATAPAAVPATAASGMSSMREIDPFAGVATPPAVQAPAESAVAADPAIAALIAEAESLDAAAEDEIAALAEAPGENGAIDIDQDEAIELVESAAFTELNDLTGPAADAETEATGTIEFSATEAVTELDQASGEFAANEVADGDPVAADQPTVEVSVQEPPAAEPPVEVGAVDVEVADPVVELAPAACEASEPAATVVRFAPVEPTVPARPPATAMLAALDRMLARVQTRRSQLMAESVA